MDLEDSRLVSKERALKYQNDFDFDLFMECSAKTGFNTNEIFISAAKLLYEDHKKNKTIPKKEEKLKLDHDDIKKVEKKGGCCKWINQFSK